MSTQGGSAKTKPGVRENGKKPSKPAETEIFDAVEEETSSTVTTEAEEEKEGETVRIRPSLTSEAPPPPAVVELPKKKSSTTSGPRLPRKAHLVLRRIEPWSAMKFSFVVSLVCFVVLFVAVAVLYGVLSALGVFDSVVEMFNQLTQSDGQNTSSINIATWFEPVRILGYTALIGAVNVVLITALSTLGSVIYNIASDLVGGIEVTFSEAE